MPMQPYHPPTERRASAARIIRGISGTPAAWRQRRGSFLVLVVGTLALLAVVMLVYVSVGNQDEHTRAALRAQKVQEDVPTQIAEYLSEKIIGADVLDRIYDDATIKSQRDDVPGSWLGTEPVLYRELTDYGFTPYEMVSGGNNALNYSSGTGISATMIFTPTGGYFRPRQELQSGRESTDISPNVNSGSTLPPAWMPSDPWLAASDPVCLGFDGLDQLSPEGRSSNANNPGYALKPASIKQSWGKISNIAPDGKFVNLYNLAPMVNGKRRANFGAKPGFGTFSVPGVGNFPRLSQDISLLVGSSTDPRNQNYTSGVVTDFGVTINADMARRPAYWDSRQLGLFRPAKEWRQAISDDYKPGGKYYLNYQYADADGDGMLDSRWQELTESREDPDNPINFLHTDGRYRYFVAVRIIDASGRVNVNTATDIAAAPTKEYPIGLGPGDVDLLRILQNRDAYERLAFFSNPPPIIAGINFPLDPVTNTATAAYDAIKGPTGPGSDNDPQKYAPVDGQAGGWPPDVGDGYNIFRAISTGSAAYTALRISVATDVFLPQASPEDPREEYSGENLVTKAALSRFFIQPGTAPQVFEPLDAADPVLGRRFWDFQPTGWYEDIQFPFPPALVNAVAPPFLGIYRPFGGAPGSAGDPHYPNAAAYPDFAARRAEFYWSTGSKAGDVFADVGRTTRPIPSGFDTSFRARAAFGLDDLSELLTYNGVNDPDVRSKLEATTAGRDDYPRTNANRPATARQSRTARFDPLRSNRAAEYEMARDSNGDGLADLDARILLDTSIRGHITTISGSRPLQPVRDVAYERLTAEEVKIDINEQLRQTRPYLTNPNTSAGLPPLENNKQAINLAVNRIFRGYADALLPNSGLGNGAAWNTSDPNFYKRRTMFYGYKGPELALYTAAHSAVNFVDMADDERGPGDTIQANRPGVFTLILNEGALNTLNMQAVDDFGRWPWWYDGNRLDLNIIESDPAKRDTRLATTDTSLIAPAANIYGVEAQPFLTGVSVITMYTDMPENKGPRSAGDTGSTDGDRDGVQAGIADDITMRRDVSRDNHDLMFRVLAFTITNPFQQKVRLGERASAFRQANGSQAVPPSTIGEWDVADPNFPPLDTEEDYYYVEFGGRYFKLSELQEQVKDAEPYVQVLSSPSGGLDTTLRDIVLEPGETVVCYALSQAPRVIYSHRLLQAEAGLFSSITDQNLLRTQIRRRIESHFRRQSLNNFRTMWIPEFDGTPAVGSNPGGSGRIGVRVDDGYEPGNPTNQLGVNDPPLFGLWSSADNENNGGNFLGGRFAFSPLLMRHDNGGARPADATDVPEKNQVAKLWRAMRTGDPTNTILAQRREMAGVPGTAVPATQWEQDSTSSQNVNLLSRNSPLNDLLADRFRVPIEGTGTRVDKVVNLDARLYFTSPGAFNREERVPSTSFNDNSPWDNPTTATIAVVAAARRPVEPSLTLASGRLPEGALPVYCLDRKDPGSYSAATPRPAWNLWEQAKIGPTDNWTGITASDFVAGSGSGTLFGDSSLVDWLNVHGNDDNRVCFTTKFLPSEYISDSVGTFQSTHRGTVVRDPGVEGSAFDTDFRPLHPKSYHYRDLYAEIVLANNNFTAASPTNPTEINRHSTLRVGDVLLPLGVGPTHVPRASGVTTNSSEEQAWTTLGESMTMALGYDMVLRPNATLYSKRDAHSLLRPLDVRLNPAAAPAWELLFDKGNLRLDYFVPFFDVNGSSTNNPVYDGPEMGGSGNDERRGNAIPLALNVFDIFSANVAGVNPRDNRRREPEGLTKAVPGLVNINTAPLAVTRTLPMVSPSAGFRDMPGSPLYSASFFVNIPPYTPTTQYFSISFTVPGGRGNVSVTGIPRGAPASLVQAALEAQPPVGKGNVSVTPGWEDPGAFPAKAVDYVITFVGDLSYAPIVNFSVPEMDPARPVVQPPPVGGAFQPGVNWWASGRQIDQSSDIGATMIGYRDKVPTLLRPDAWHKSIPGQTDAARATAVNQSPWVTVADFRDLDLAAGGGSIAPNDSANRAGRLLQTEIPGLNEQPGFASIGALMTVRHRAFDITNPGGFDLKRGAFRNSIDFMGYSADPLQSLAGAGGMGRAQNSSRIGIDSVLYGSEEITTAAIPANADPFRTDSMENEFKEKLAVANALSNTVTTRSDYFICWFVVHGYQQSDLENLAPDDPLVPSVARRFLMVVDRSNVVKSGDKPRILLFKELPYSGG